MLRPAIFKLHESALRMLVEPQVVPRWSLYCFKVHFYTSDVPKCNVIAYEYPAHVQRKWNMRRSSRWQQIDYLVSEQQAASYNLCVGGFLLHLLASVPDNVGFQRQEPDKPRVIEALRAHFHRHLTDGRGEAPVDKDTCERFPICLPTAQF